MSNPGRRLDDLLHKFSADKASAEEIREMLDLLHQDKNNAGLENVLMELKAKAGSHASPLQADWESMWLDIYNRTQRTSWWRIAAAAAVLILFSLSAWLWLDHRTHASPIAATKAIAPKGGNDAAPGKTRAILTLANGAQLVLDSASNGMLAQQGNTKIQNMNGALTYKGGAQQEEKVLYNNLTTHRGEQYPLTLSDGTKIWLNAASSIRFPVTFTGNERRVEISGEVYFEVAKNAAKPFRVQLNDSTQVQVLGTSFNINAYADETAITTTLLEGSVKIILPTPAGGSAQRPQEVKLIPRQQAQLIREPASIHVLNDADLDEVIAWKNGFFQFTGADLPALIRQLSRWYDLDVVYEGDIRHHEFTGKITRNINLASLLKALKLSGVNFRIEGNKLIVAS
jgi:transmembrane sensor